MVKIKFGIQKPLSQYKVFQIEKNRFWVYQVLKVTGKHFSSLQKSGQDGKNIFFNKKIKIIWYFSPTLPYFRLKSTFRSLSVADNLKFGFSRSNTPITGSIAFESQIYFWTFLGFWYFNIFSENLKKGQKMPKLTFSEIVDLFWFFWKIGKI